MLLSCFSPFFILLLSLLVKFELDLINSHYTLERKFHTGMGTEILKKIRSKKRGISCCLGWKEGGLVESGQTYSTSPVNFSMQCFYCFTEVFPCWKEEHCGSQDFRVQRQHLGRIDQVPGVRVSGQTLKMKKRKKTVFISFELIDTLVAQILRVGK